MRYFFLLLTALLLTACGKADKFTVEVKMEDLGIEVIRMIYISDGGRLLTVEGRAKKPGDPVRLEGESADYTLARLLRADGTPLTCFTARNGEKIKINISADGSEIEIKGNEACDSLTAFNRSVATLGPADVNRRIARFVKANPASVASTMLLVTRFDAAANPEMADSLYSLLEPTVKSSGVVKGWAEQLALAVSDDNSRKLPAITVYGPADSVISITAFSNPHTLIAFTPPVRTDSIDRLLRRLRSDYSSKRLKIYEITLNTDSSAWNREAKRDSSRWSRGWVPGGAASPALRRLNITRCPFFIVADSSGSQCLRTSSVGAIERQFETIR